jgi:hypothetical protein
MKKLTVAELAKKINAENEVFKKMTKAEKRVVIAQDCLARIEIEQVVPEFNRFCDVKDSFERKNISIKETLATSEVVCSACAKGSLFMSYIGRVNNFTFSDINNDNYKKDAEHIKLLKLFTLKQLALIETVFEGSQYIYSSFTGVSYDFDEVKVKKFRNKHYDSDIKTDKATQLLTAICENIIKNNGTFVL